MVDVRQHQNTFQRRRQATTHRESIAKRRMTANDPHRRRLNRNQQTPVEAQAKPSRERMRSRAGLLYSWIRPNRAAVRLREPQLKVVPLTALPGDVGSPTFSPDGSQLAFAWDGENNGAGYDLYVKVVGSDKPLRLTNHPSTWISAAWSPDGRSIAMSRSAGKDDSGIYLMLPTGGPERKLIARTALAWYGNELLVSDGKRLAYTDVNQDPPHDVGLFSLSLDTLAKASFQTDCGLTAMLRYRPAGGFCVCLWRH
jgi:hypothetical protein